MVGNLFELAKHGPPPFCFSPFLVFVRTCSLKPDWVANLLGEFPWLFKKDEEPMGSLLIGFLAFNLDGRWQVIVCGFRHERLIFVCLFVGGTLFGMNLTGNQGETTHLWDVP